MRKPPKLCRHKNSAFIYVRKKQVYLGKWGSDEAQAAYDRYLIEWAKNGGVARLSQPSDRVLLVELVNAFLADYKARPVKSVPDLYSYDQVSVRLAKLFPDYLAEDFRVRDLELFRDSFKKAGFQCGGKKKEWLFHLQRLYGCGLESNDMNGFPGEGLVAAVELLVPGLAGVGVEDGEPALVEVERGEVAGELRAATIRSTACRPGRQRRSRRARRRGR